MTWVASIVRHASYRSGHITAERLTNVDAGVDDAQKSWRRLARHNQCPKITQSCEVDKRAESAAKTAARQSSNRRP